MIEYGDIYDLECPWCGEISFKPREVKKASDGQEFVFYACTECPCEGSFPDIREMVV